MLFLMKVYLSLPLYFELPQFYLNTPHSFWIGLSTIRAWNQVLENIENFAKKGNPSRVVC